MAETPVRAAGAGVGTIDDRTHTLYASGVSSISVINTATCNATTTTGCNAKAPTIPIGTYPGIPALNPTTQTLYVAFGKTGNKVAAINAGTCNAQTTSGGGTPPGVVNVGAGTNQIAVSTATDTIYAPSAGANFSGGDTVAVIDGATCDATDLAGCGQPAATVKVGAGPDGVAVNDLTHTIYIANNADGNAPGTVSVINGATCNGADTVGCRARSPPSRSDAHPAWPRSTPPPIRSTSPPNPARQSRSSTGRSATPPTPPDAPDRPPPKRSAPNPSTSPSTTTPTPSTRSRVAAQEPPHPSSKGRSRKASAK